MQREDKKKTSASKKHILSAVKKTYYWDGLGGLISVKILAYSRVEYGYIEEVYPVWKILTELITSNDQSLIIKVLEG